MLSVSRLVCSNWDGQDTACRRSPTIPIVRCTNPSVSRGSFPRWVLYAVASFAVGVKQERDDLLGENRCRIRHDVRFRKRPTRQDGRPPVERKLHSSKSTCKNMRLPVGLQGRIIGHQWLRKTGHFATISSDRVVAMRAPRRAIQCRRIEESNDLPQMVLSLSTGGPLVQATGATGSGRQPSPFFHLETT